MDNHSNSTEHLLIKMRSNSDLESMKTVIPFHPEFYLETNLLSLEHTTPSMQSVRLSQMELLLMGKFFLLVLISQWMRRVILFLLVLALTTNHFLLAKHQMVKISYLGNTIRLDQMEELCLVDKLPMVNRLNEDQTSQLTRTAILSHLVLDLIKILCHPVKLPTEKICHQERSTQLDLTARLIPTDVLRMENRLVLPQTILSMPTSK
jgi:hypothetical protein